MTRVRMYRLTSFLLAHPPAPTVVFGVHSACCWVFSSPLDVHSSIGGCRGCARCCMMSIHHRLRASYNSRSIRIRRVGYPVSFSSPLDVHSSIGGCRGCARCCMMSIHHRLRAYSRSISIRRVGYPIRGVGYRVGISWTTVDSKFMFSLSSADVSRGSASWCGMPSIMCTIHLSCLCRGGGKVLCASLGWSFHAGTAGAG